MRIDQRGQCDDRVDCSRRRRADGGYKSICDGDFLGASRRRVGVGDEMGAGDGTHKSVLATDANVAALAFPPPLWGRDREGGSRERMSPLPPPSPTLPRHKSGPPDLCTILMRNLGKPEFRDGGNALEFVVVHRCLSIHYVSVGGMRSAFGGRKGRSNTWPALGACGSS